MLKYFENSISANITNPDIEFIHHTVKRLKEHEEINLDYMKSWEWDEYNQKIGRDHGLIVGREEGYATGLEEGLAAGREEGLTIGREEGLAAGREEGLATGREEGILALIRSCRKYNATNDEIIIDLMSNFSITREEAQGYLKQYSKQS